MPTTPSTLPLRRRVAAWLYVGVAVTSLVLGSIYLFRPTFMPYHAVALGKEWSELEAPTQTLIKALMEVAEILPFGRTSRSTVFRIKVDNDILAAQVFQADFLVAGCVCREIGNDAVHSWGRHRQGSMGLSG